MTAQWLSHFGLRQPPFSKEVDSSELWAPSTRQHVTRTCRWSSCSTQGSSRGSSRERATVTIWPARNAGSSSKSVPATHRTEAPQRRTTEGCTSDFSCKTGQRCVKATYTSSGVCMDTVGEHGGRSYKTPRLDSVGPKMPSSTDCKFLTHCPLWISVRCEKRRLH